MDTMLIKDATFRLFWYLDRKRTNPGMFPKITTLKEYNRFSLEEIRERQLQKLKKIVSHAYTKVPFYRRSFDNHGFHPHDLKDLDDIKRIPLLTKDDIQSNLYELIAEGCSPESLTQDATGGSTGKPLIFFKDRNDRAWFEASDYYIMELWGIKPWDKKAALWGADRDIPEMRLRARLRLSLDRFKILNSFNMTQERMIAYANQLVAWQPDYIIGYASSLSVFCDFLRDKGIQDIKPKVIRSSAETLSIDQRNRVKEALGNNLFNFYGSREIPNIAFECETHNGLHEFSPLRYIEVLDRNGGPVKAGEMGTMVITDLVAHSMPFIRYSIEDMGIPASGQCSCGICFPIIEEIKGRTSDFIHLKNGKLIHGEFFTHLFYGQKGIDKFQVYQKAIDKIDVYIVMKGSITNEDINILKKKFLEKIGYSIVVDFHFVSEIPSTKSGKHRFTISDVK